MPDLTIIGEGQIRLTAPQGERLPNTRQLRMTVVCSEANVAGFFSQLDRHTSWCSVLLHSNPAERYISEFRSVGVDMSNMVQVPEGKMALYFMEPGGPPMPLRVTYDHLNTAFHEIRVEDMNWDSMLSTRLVFVIGITTTLTKVTARVIRHFVDAAHERNIDIALDVNYRGLPWSPERAHEVLAEIASRSKIIFCSRKDAGIALGTEGERAEVSCQLREAFGTEYVISTDGYNGVHYAGPDGLDDRQVDIAPVTDRPGAGDSFVTATLHDFLGGDVRQGVSYDLRVSKYALTHHGDLTHIASSELAIPTTTDIIR